MGLPASLVRTESNCSQVWCKTFQVCCYYAALQLPVVVGSQEDHMADHEEEDGVGSEGWEVGGVAGRVWLAGLARVTTISLVGLLAVAAIPLLRGNHRQAGLQLLVSLAAGTLLGNVHTSTIISVPHQ